MKDKAESLWQRMSGLRVHASDVLGADRTLENLEHRLRFLEEFYEVSNEAFSWCSQRLDEDPSNREAVYLDFAIAHGLAPSGRNRSAATHRSLSIRAIGLYQEELYRITGRFVSGLSELPDFDDQSVFEAANAAYTREKGHAPKTASTLRKHYQGVAKRLGATIPIPKDSYWERPGKPI